ncbi:MAG TPA: hypothetical protein VLA67_06300 [Nitrospiraceae bacterium]|nr:hypothetical protein [Nitrospiraceae bacterium]
MRLDAVEEGWRACVLSNNRLEKNALLAAQGLKEMLGDPIA